MRRGQKRPIEVLIFRDLLIHDKMTAKELSYRYEVSTRTIYRAVDILLLNGIPIRAVKGGYGGGLYLDKDYIKDLGRAINAKRQNY